MTTSSTPPSTAARTRAAWPPCPPWRSCRPAAAPSRPDSAPRSSCRSASSTPAVVPAMTSRRARKPRRQMDRQRIGVDVEQPALRGRDRCTPPPARNLHRQRRAAPACRRPAPGCRPHRAPPAAVDGSMRRRSDPTSRTPASAPGQPDGVDTAAANAATNRVLTAPARTDTTTASVGSSVIRSPSTCRFSMPAAFSAASISLPPPWTMPGRRAGNPPTALASRAAVPDPRAVRRQISGRAVSRHRYARTSELQTDSNFEVLLVATTAPCARRCRASR